ncbi:MAG: hypothetical protein FWD68_11625 [Alphaproteobacteria bacterium]|nr:hypothetical protein [Alphaproteobacteria bacterium]
MAIGDFNTMDQYIVGMMRRAAHHARNVEAVIPALRGFVEQFGENIKPLVRNGDPKNTSWFDSKATGKHYAWRYDHALNQIELRENTTRGRIVAFFDNSTSNTDILTTFKTL